ncbi:MAG: hypothetical protein LBF63_05850 [Treponema sp.]|jgi:hypothetical protein|nr:hypothetical protein [Treponema sp.]
MYTQNVSPNDKSILRELAKQYAEIAVDDVNRERERRIRDIHGLKRDVRPILWFEQIPWHELNGTGELSLRCEGDFARGMENHIRQTLFRWKYFQGDMVVEDVYYVGKAFSDSGFGMSIKEQTAATDAANSVISHHFEDQLDSEEKLDLLTLPVVQSYPEKDKANLEAAQEILDGIMPVRLRGYGIEYRPWDYITRLRGITNCLMDMLDRPELIHKTMRKFCDIFTARSEQMEAQDLLDYRFPIMNCTPTLTNDLPASDYDGGRVRLKDVWVWSTAQLFVSASPDMNNEFNLQYLLPFISRCGLVHYGCCEPLHNVISRLRKVPNLRKISASPWTRLREQAEQTGGDYVLSRKPNPALVAGKIDACAIENEIQETIEVCRETGTPFEYILKDISTVNYNVGNLTEWGNLVSGVMDRYYK